MDNRSSKATVMLAILLVSTSAPAVAGEWTEDTWLENIIGPERLDNGDEFGCHGYEGVSTLSENWVIEACRDYLMESTNASRWGRSPISFGIPGQSLDEVTAEQLISSGFMIVGDKLSEVPDGLILASRYGASLEKGVANNSLIESAEEDTLVSIYWRARIDDLRVREDKDAISWLEEQPLWFTTWGEWNLHRIAGQSTVTTIKGSQITSTSQIASPWSVPGTMRLQFNAEVSSVYYSTGENYPVIAHDVRKLQVGWRQIEGGILLTQAPGSTLTIELESEPESFYSTPLMTFNDHHHAVTVVGHHTTNLFQWTTDFVNSELVFTWLIERPAGIEQSWFLPALALTILIATPVTIRYLIKKDIDAQ
tara:strand:+ start:1401 stop:2498 length:1098 start_codon:yes stop_codon:yes gene_type:complete